MMACYQQKITNIINIILQKSRQMLSDQTHRSHNTSKYVTPRKQTVKSKKIEVNLNTKSIDSLSEKEKENIDFCSTYECTDRTNKKNNKFKQWRIDDFQVITQMGRGKFGYVYAAKEKQSDYLVALKKMSKIQLRDNDFQQQVKRQIIIQGGLNHPNILKLYGYFWDNENVYMILQFATGGELFNILQKSKRLPEWQVSVIIRQVCLGLSYLHSHNIIHRDIKPQNILVCGNKVKIADFGWSIHTETRRETLCGTLDYLAPQVVKGQTHDHTIDVWQLGILAYQLSVGTPPFETSSNQQTYQRIVKEQVLFPSYISYELRQFVRKILQKNPQKRIQCWQILRQPFITKYIQAELS